MALVLPDKWIWDSWFTFDGENYHAFYLHASRALGDSNRRHRNPIVGHAISKDLTNWTVVRDALIVSDEPQAFDSWTTWTGSVIRDDNGLWWMFYTGTSRGDGGEIQRVGAATSADLMVWEKLPQNPISEADAQYGRFALADGRSEVHWRDPWVFRFPEGVSTGAAAVGVENGLAPHQVWHMLTTAKGQSAAVNERGVTGHATSTDLVHWKTQAPLSAVGSSFDQMEVFQFEIVDGVPLLIFCCGWRELNGRRLAQLGQRDATYSLVVNQDLSELNFELAEPFGFEGRYPYAARLIKGADEKWNLIGFVLDENNEFEGYLTDPIPVTAHPVRGLVTR